MSRNRLASCDCKTHQCGGKLVTYNEKRMHQREDEEQRQKQAEEDIVSGVFSLTFREESFISTSLEGVSAPIPLSTAVDLPPSPANQTLHLDEPVSSPIVHVVKENADMNSAGPLNFHQLVDLDVQLDARIQSARKTIEKGCSVAKESLQWELFEKDLDEHLVWLSETRQRLESAVPEVGEENNVLLVAMLQRANSEASEITQWRARLSDSMGFKPPDENMAVIDTSMHFRHPFYFGNPLFLLATFTALILNVLGNVSRTSCKFVLRMMNMILQRALGPTERHLKVPSDIRTIRHHFGLEAKVTIYASCPKCCRTYPPKEEDRILVYPAVCIEPRYPGGPPCNTKLTKTKVDGQKSIRTPLRPFPVQCFDTFVGNLLSRPHIEDYIENMSKMMHAETLTDIACADVVRDLPGNDGKPFVDPNCQETRLVWEVSVDWFNPYHNKIGGKTASVGPIALACLLLPPSLRYKPENMYLMGITPGPREPSTSQTNHYLRPLIDTCLHSYEHGTWYSRTSKHPRGRRVRNAIAVEAADLPGARKISGLASHSSETFCHLCHLPRSRINDLEWQKWKPKTYDEILEEAKKWRDAPTKSAQETIRKGSGVRWSEFMRLPYWTHHRIAIDGMHMFFLGMVQHHFRTILGMDVPDRDEIYTYVDPKEISRAEALLSQVPPPCQSALKKFTVPVLKTLCEKRGLLEINQPTQRLKKRDLISELLKTSGATIAHAALFNEGIPDAETTINSLDDIVGMEYSETESGDNHNGAVLTKKDVATIRADIAATTRPAWHVAPPPNFGESSHGKLKADQWRSVIEFDLPVSLVYLQATEAQDQKVSEERKQIRDLQVRSTMLLSIAIRLGTSDVTSRKHADEYKRVIVEYLESVLKLRPDRNLVPNQHNAVHFADLLVYLGPARYSWMFPFERLNGLLQRLNINFKIGQLEETMLRAFCAAANIKAFIRSPGCPPVLAESAKFVEECYGDETSESAALINEMSALGIIPIAKAKRGTRKGDLEDDIFNALVTKHADLVREVPFFALTREVMLVDRLTINGLQFAKKTSTKRNSLVFFSPTMERTLVPGVIREIFGVAHNDKTYSYLLAVHRYKPSTISSNPFEDFSDFGAGIWSKALSRDVEIVPARRKVAHAIQRGWDSNHFVMKSLHRV